MRPAAVAAGAICIAGGAVLALVYSLTVALGAGDASAAQAATTFGALALSAIVMGAGLIGAGLRRAPLHPPWPFSTRGPLVWVASFVAVLGIGSALLRQGTALVVVALAAIHFLPALRRAPAIVGHAGRAGNGTAPARRPRRRSAGAAPGLFRAATRSEARTR